ncbi:hypothetical protein M3B46_13165 [Sphingobacterium daejeonense]|uniref:hypothetical protein n=1 Tax=Sphingobacterium daejeonense TaxID=371142 RepID=UPI0021A35D68|nr:hypothetical protein [Sphingobacterium daejeonense]MCT1531946.1 hypothetical protein [Sphingobacterium daejeonense]
MKKISIQDLNGLVPLSNSELKRISGGQAEPSTKTCKCGNCDVTVRDTTDCNNLDCSTWANDPECYPN